MCLRGGCCKYLTNPRRASGGKKQITRRPEKNIRAAFLLAITLYSPLKILLPLEHHGKAAVANDYFGLPPSMILPSIASLATDPNVTVALVSDTLKSTVNAHFVDSPSLDYTNIPTRLTCLLPTPDSLRNLLDALVTVSSSTSPDGNETIACALRLDSDHSIRPAVEFILSSHEPIRGGTVRHFQEIWRQMLVISKLPYKRGADRESFIHLLTTFRHTMYAYTLRKLRVEFARHMAIIDEWRIQNTAASGHLVADLRSGDDAHFRMPLVETLFHLGRCRSAFASMREDDQEPKRLISTAHDFMTLVAALELAKDAVDKLLLHIVSLRVLSTRCFQCQSILKSFLSPNY